MTDAVNSSKLVFFPISAASNSYHHDNPLELNLPMPCLHVSEIFVSVRTVSVMLLMAIPFVPSIICHGNLAMEAMANHLQIS